VHFVSGNAPTAATPEHGRNPPLPSFVHSTELLLFDPPFCPALVPEELPQLPIKVLETGTGFPAESTHA